MDTSAKIANLSTGTAGVALVEITAQADYSHAIGLAIGLMTALIQIYNAHQINKSHKK